MVIPQNFTPEFFEKEIRTLLEQNLIEKGGRVRLSVDRRPGGFFLPHNNDVDYFIEAYSLPNNKFLLNEAGYKVDQYEDIKKQINLLSSYKTKNGLVYIMAKLR